MRQKNKFIYGFTLIELLIVIAITGALSTYVIFTVVNKLELGRDAKRKMDTELIRGGVDEYYEATKCYPLTLGDCSQRLFLGTTTYIESVPCDSKTKIPYLYEVEESNCPQWYRLYVLLENESDVSIRYAHCLNGCGPNCMYNYGISSSNTTLDFCALPIPTSSIPQPTTAPSSTPIPTFIPAPTNDPLITPTTIPLFTPLPTMILQFACSPGGGQTGRCVLYDDPVESECPEVYPNDPNCQYQCYLKTNRCKTSSGLENSCASEPTLASFLICLLTNFLNSII